MSRVLCRRGFRLMLPHAVVELNRSVVQIGFSSLRRHGPSFLMWRPCMSKTGRPCMPGDTCL